MRHEPGSELAARGGVAGVLVDLDDDGGQVWVPIGAAALLQPVRPRD